MKAPTQEQLNDPEWWSKSAPENATHYCPVAKLFYDDSYPIAPCCIPRPTKPAAPEWDGEGLPPVGSICEARHNKSDCWIKREILAIGETMALVRIIPGQVDNDGDPVSGEHTLQIAYAEFRPIRTQAERNRDALADLCRAKFNQHTSSTNSHLWQQIADAIIASGWRKGDS